MKRFSTSLMLVCALGLIPACGSGEEHDHGADAGAFDEITTAVCVLSPTEGNTASGVLTFTQVPHGVRVHGTVSGLTPNSKHGFHIHQFADVSAPDGTATGGHYNPEGNDEHGLPSTHDHGDHQDTVTGGHAGDMGNLEANDQGVAEFDVTFANITLADNNAILGRSIIVHANEDTGGQPTGNAGPRIAQGVIGIADVGEDK